MTRRGRLAFLAALLWGLAQHGGAAAVEVLSSDRHWSVSADRSDLRVGEQARLLLKVRPLAQTHGCPHVTGLALEMPQHGHGSPYVPTITRQGECAWVVDGVELSMRGTWRARVLMQDGATTVVADLNLEGR